MANHFEILSDPSLETEKGCQTDMPSIDKSKQCETTSSQKDDSKNSMTNISQSTQTNYIIFPKLRNFQQQPTLFFRRL